MTASRGNGNGDLPTLEFDQEDITVLWKRDNSDRCRAAPMWTAQYYPFSSQEPAYLRRVRELGYGMVQRSAQNVMPKSVWSVYGDGDSMNMNEPVRLSLQYPDNDIRARTTRSSAWYASGNHISTTIAIHPRPLTVRRTMSSSPKRSSPGASVLRQTADWMKSSTRYLLATVRA